MATFNFLFFRIRALD